MMKLNVMISAATCIPPVRTNGCKLQKARVFLYVRDEVIDRLWNTIATEGWDDNKIRAERFQRIGSSNVPALCGLQGVHRICQ